MPPKKAERLAGGFFDLKELAIDEPILVLFRIGEFHEVEKASGFEGWTFPVIADAVVCSGPRKGEVHLGERFIGAITSILRGVQNARKNKGEAPQPPVNEVGDEIVARIEVMNKGKSNAAAVGNVPSDVEFDAVLKFYGDGSVWTTTDAPQREKVSAGAGTQVKDDLPW
jgi:hypothetical protein